MSEGQQCARLPHGFFPEDVGVADLVGEAAVLHAGEHPVANAAHDDTHACYAEGCYGEGEHAANVRDGAFGHFRKKTRSWFLCSPMLRVRPVDDQRHGTQRGNAPPRGMRRHHRENERGDEDKTTHGVQRTLPKWAR